MTLQIAFIFAILLVSLVLFITEWIRMDVVSLMVLAVLAVSGTVTPDEALAGFSNAAVVTVWAMFILSEGLTRTGIARIVGRQVTALAGRYATLGIGPERAETMVRQYGKDLLQSAFRDLQQGPQLLGKECGGNRAHLAKIEL